MMSRDNRQTKMYSDATTQFQNSSVAFVRRMVAGVALINLLVFAMVAFSLYQSLGEFEARADVTTQNLSQLLAEGIAGDIDKFDIALLVVADEVERQAASGGIDRKELNAFLERQQQRLPETFGVRVLDAQGIVSYGRGVNPRARQNNSDREYFVRQRNNLKVGLVIAKPILTRIDKKWAIVLSRPIHLADGSFGGVVYMNVGLDYLTKTFPTIDVGLRGSVSLKDAEMNLYAVYPVPANIDKVIGEKFIVPELQELIQARRDAGTYITAHTVDGVERKYAVRGISNYGLYVVVGIATEEYMSRWKDQAIKTSVLVVLFCLATLISSWLIVRDIAERRQAEAAVRRLNAELEQRVAERTAQLEAANKELEEFSYSMSHDMSTPLRALDGFSRILMEEHGASLNDEGRRLLMVLRDNAQRMGRLVDDILHYLSMGRRKMKFGFIDIAGLASEIVTELQAAAPERRLQLEIGALPPARGDRDMIREVLQNLLSNAVKFSQAGSNALIELSGVTEGDENIYSVKDHGIGFDMRYADKLFRVFERVHATGQYEGSGIGLALVNRIINRHGGRVWAESKVNEGATIYFALPTKEASHG